MSIDTNNYTGEEKALAAGEQKPLNSYLAETQMEDFSMPAIPEEKQAELSDPFEPAEAEAEPIPEQEEPQDRNFRALAGEVEKLKAERENDRKEYQQHLDLMRANSVQRQAPIQEQPKPKPMFDGMGDNDIPNVAEIRQEWQSRESQYQARIQELQVAQFHSDYAEVCEKFAAPLLKENPVLLNSVLNADNKALALYEIGKLAQQARSASAQASTPPPQQQQAPAAPKSATPAQNAQKIVQNARKPGSLSAVGGASTLSKADYFASMSDADFMKYATKNLEGI